MPKKSHKYWENEGVTALQMSILVVSFMLLIASVFIYQSRDDIIIEENWPVGSLEITVENTTDVKITFGAFFPLPEPMEMKFIIETTTGDFNHTELWFTQPPDNQTVIMGTTEGITATYSDLNYLGNTINSGDYIRIEGLMPHTGYRLLVYHYPTQSLCLIAGETLFYLE